MCTANTAFQPLGVPCLIHEKPVSARAQKSAQASFTALVRIEEFFFQKTGEELLREIGSVFRSDVPLRAHVFVDRPPVRSGDSFDRPRSHSRIIALRSQYERVARYGEASVL